MDSFNQLVKFRTLFHVKKPDRRISCKDLGQGDCEGWLWIKKSSLLKSKFIRRWCILKLRCLYFYKHTEYERAEGIIHLEDFKVCPWENFKSKDFYFKIYNKFVSFTFAVESQPGFMKWLNKLQLSASNISLEGCEDLIPYLTPPSNRTATPANLDGSKKLMSDEYLGYSESEDSDVDSYKVSSRSSECEKELKYTKNKTFMNAAEVCSSEERSSAESYEASMNAIKRIVEIERMIREKSQLLAQIDNFLKYPLTSARIQEFWDEYSDLIISPSERNN